MEDGHADSEHEEEERLEEPQGGVTGHEEVKEVEVDGGEKIDKVAAAGGTVALSDVWLCGVGLFGASGELRGKVLLHANCQIATRGISPISLITSEIWMLSSSKCSHPIVLNPGLLWAILWAEPFFWLMRIKVLRLLRAWFCPRR
jgi:hypothetical protein